MVSITNSEYDSQGVWKGQIPQEGGVSCILKDDYGFCGM